MRKSYVYVNSQLLRRFAIWNRAIWCSGVLCHGSIRGSLTGESSRFSQHCQEGIAISLQLALTNAGHLRHLVQGLRGVGGSFPAVSNHGKSYREEHPVPWRVFRRIARNASQRGSSSGRTSTTFPDTIAGLPCLLYIIAIPSQRQVLIASQQRTARF